MAGEFLNTHILLDNDTVHKYASSRQTHTAQAAIEAKQSVLYPLLISR